MTQAQDTTGKGGRPRGKDYPLEVVVYLNADGKGKLQRLAEKEGESLSAAVRRLVREAR